MQKLLRNNLKYSILRYYYATFLEIFNIPSWKYINFKFKTIDFKIFYFILSLKFRSKLMILHTSISFSNTVLFINYNSNYLSVSLKL